MRGAKVLIGLAVFVALLVGGDFFLKTVTETRAEDQMKAVLRLRSTPDVTLSGWPFTIKALAGNFPTVKVSIADARHRGVEIENVEVALRDVDFELAKLLSGSEDAIRTSGGQGSAVLTEEGVAQALQRQGVGATVKLVGDGTVRIDEPRLPEPVDGTMTLQGRDVVIAAEGVPQSYSFRLPAPIEGISYDGLTVEEGRAILAFSLEGGTLTAPR